MLCKCRVFLLALLLSCLLASCSSCPKVAIDRDFEVETYQINEVRFALPVSYQLEPQEIENDAIRQWKGPRGMVRFYTMNPPQDLDAFRQGFLQGVRGSYEGLPNRTIPTEQVWGTQTVVGNQLEVMLKERSLALDFYFIPAEKHLYAVCFQRTMARGGPVDSEFTPVEQLFWRSLCLK